jgi:hypothetical protein
MAAGGVALAGWGSAITRLNAMSVALEKAGDDERWVGTHLWYAIFPEFGTDRGVRPYGWFRLAVGTAASKSGVFGSKALDFEAFALAPSAALLDPLAEIVVANAKANLQRFGLWESGDLYRSIAAGKTMREMVKNSKAGT